MSPGLWENVLVAGGAILGALLPLDRCWKTMPVAAVPGQRWGALHDFSLVQHAACYERAADDSLVRTPSAFLGRVRWPGSDIDVFLHGITDPAVADAKALALLKHFKSIMQDGNGSAAIVPNPVAFIRTQNTVTIDGGPSFRKVQIITRLYSSAADILNSFDIDCCCVGFDGADVLMTPRAQQAIVHKANTVNLSIRGNAYEYRLCKCENVSVSSRTQTHHNVSCI